MLGPRPIHIVQCILNYRLFC